MGIKILVPPHPKFGPNTGDTFVESMDSESHETSYVTAGNTKKLRAPVPKTPRRE